MRKNILGFLKKAAAKLFTINDSPQRIALGAGLGVFLGILPGAGPIAALFLAVLFRVNRAAALFGCLLTNTWLSFVTFLLSIKAGSLIMGLQWQEVFRDFSNAWHGFRITDLFQVSILKIILPLLAGYLLISLLLGLTVYLVTLVSLIIIRRAHR